MTVFRDVLNVTNSFRCKETAIIVALTISPFVTACSKTETAPQSTSALSPTVVEKPLVTGAPEIARISAKGGTKIAVLVNKQPITNTQIKRRVAFVKLRRIKGNSKSIATNELIDEAVKMQEARRIRSVVSKKEIDSAYVRFAKNNRMTPAILTKLLDQRGITKRGFKDYIKASMSWQRAVGARLQAKAAGRTGASQPTGPSWLPAVGKDSAKEQEYTIQQIVFIVPANKRNRVLKARRIEATRFRSKLDGCTNARELAKEIRDVTVIDRGRLLESELPLRWVKEIKVTPVGKVTRILNDPKGVEMIAVCKTREVIGKGNTTEADAFTGSNFANAASELDKTYLAEIKKRAVIVRR